jgi:hypothetical protein
MSLETLRCAAVAAATATTKTEHKKPLSQTFGRKFSEEMSPEYKHPCRIQNGQLCFLQIVQA